MNHLFSDVDNVLVPLRPTDVPRPTERAAEPASRQSRPLPAGDPVLRYVLVQAGVVTVEQLAAAEVALRAMGMLATGGPVYRAGSSSDGPVTGDGAC